MHHKSLVSRLMSLMSRRELKARLMRVAMVLSCMAVFCVTYMLVAPVLTQEWPAVCGLEEHVHTGECYTVELREIPAEDVPEGIQTSVGHTHTDDCYEETVERELVCDEEESEGHTHDASCEETTRTLTCDEAESEGHHHSSSCYETSEVLTCTDDSEDHQHDSGCYETEETLVCDEEESDGHTHSDSCYEEETVYTCGLEETEGHTHDDSCYEEITTRKLICGLEETSETQEPAETETGARYEEVKVLTCGKEEHTHTDSCYNPVEETRPAYLCGYDIEHTHTDKCYFADGELKCTIPEHTHTDACLAGGSVEPLPPVEILPPVVESDTIFPETLPEGYVEAEVFQPMAVFAMTDMEDQTPADPTALVYVPEDAFETPVLFVPQPLYDEDETQALADELTQAGVEFDGLAALDLSFFDEDYEEREPLTGPVFVKLTLTQPLPEGAEPTLYHMTADGPEAVPADVDYDADTGTLTLGFAVDSFSSFTVTWRETDTYGSNPLSIVYAYYDGTTRKEITADGLSNFVSISTGNNLTEGTSSNKQTAEDYIKANLPAGYEFDHYEIEVSGKRVEVTNVSYNPSKDGNWHYQPAGSSNWSVWDNGLSGDPTLYVVCKSTATAAVTITCGQYTNDEFQTLSDKSTVPVSVGTTLLTPLGLTPPAGYQISYFETDLGNRVDSVLCDAGGNLTFMNGKETVTGETLRAICEVAAHDWTGDPRNRVNFFVNYTYQVLGALGEFNAPANDSTWTQSVYETYLFGDKGYTENGSEGDCPAAYIRANRSESGVMEYYIARDPDQDSNNRNLLEAHRHVMDAATEDGYTNTFDNHSKGSTATYWLQSLPTDQQVMDGIKKWVKNGGNSIVDVNGNVLDPELLNTREFAVRWFAFKYRDDDKFWHIDGVLVKKEGHLVVEKTFSGDQTAINAVKSGDNGFYISVAEEKENDDEETDLYRLYLDRVEMRQIDETTHETTYTRLENVTPTVSGNTYTWALDTANTSYHIREHHYTSNSNSGTVRNDVSTVTEYRFSNLDPADRDEYHSENWTTFVSDPGLTLTGRSYAPEVGEESWQTVHFRNRYLPANALILHTVDAETDDPLPNVEFRVTANGQPLTLWLLDGVYYFYRPQGYDGLGVTQTSTARVNEAGELIFGGVGQEGTTGIDYVLTESARPAGYSEAALQFSIDGDGKITQSDDQKAASTNATDVTPVGTGNVYITDLRHTPEKAPITAEKKWADGENHSGDTVTLTLLRNGKSTGKTLTLTSDGWTGSFGTDFSVYGPGGKIEYTVTETVNDKSPEDALYVLTVARTDTTNADGATTEIHLAATNSPSADAGTFSFVKMAEGNTTAGLSGAVFGLYQDSACTVSLGTLTSDANGLVASPRLPIGTYYLKEIQAPEGYVLSGVTYQVVIHGAGSFTIQAVDTDTSKGMGQSADKTTYFIFNRSAYVAELPATGGMGTTLWYISGLAMMLSAAILLYKRSSRREEGESQ